MPDCAGEIEKVLMLDLKRMESAGGVIPSMDFSWDDYQQFLSFATPYELENDILTKETVQKMALYNTYELDRGLDEVVNFFYEPDCEPKVPLNQLKKEKELSLFKVAQSIANTKRNLKQNFKG